MKVTEQIPTLDQLDNKKLRIEIARLRAALEEIARLNPPRFDQNGYGELARKVLGDEPISPPKQLSR